MSYNRAHHTIILFVMLGVLVGLEAGAWAVFPFEIAALVVIGLSCLFLWLMRAWIRAKSKHGWI